MKRFKRWWNHALILFLGIALGAAVGGGVGYVALGRTGALRASGDSAEHAATEEHGEHEEGTHEPGVVHLPEEKWKATGLEVKPARRGELTVLRKATGKITPNEDRLAHIFSLVEGIVHEVPIRFGDHVEAGAELAVIDSRGVGQAKLDLVQARTEVRISRVNLDWSRMIFKNVQALIQALEEEPAVQDLIARFDERPIGEYREQLLSAYAQMRQARTEFERDRELNRRDVLSDKSYIRTKAAYESALARFEGLMEQIKFRSERELIQAEQALEQAKVAEGSARSALMILGHTHDEVERMDPLGEGEEIAHYLIDAPFAGTITQKDIVTEERVGPNTKLFDLINLETVWLQTDIYENDLPLLAGLQGRTIRFRADAYPDRVFEAEVFYSGEIVDPQTRTVQMMAKADNADRLLKPGQFVTIELPAGTDDDVLLVPASAVVEDREETFVFVHRGGEEFERRDVTIGRRVPERVVEITAGLEAGEPVAVAGTFALKTELQGLGESGHAH